MKSRNAATVALLVLTLAASEVGAAESDEATRAIARGFAALRAMDCARCHGRDFDGWAAPSLTASVREAPRERFDKWLLDGDIARGMPGYRGQALIEREIDAIYAYLAARARGEVGAGRLDTGTGTR